MVKKHINFEQQHKHKLVDQIGLLRVVAEPKRRLVKRRSKLVKIFQSPLAELFDRFFQRESGRDEGIQVATDGFLAHAEFFNELCRTSGT